MQRSPIGLLAGFTVTASLSFVHVPSSVRAAVVVDATPAWNAAGAAAYLDQRIVGTGCQCMSCHTALAYALARPALDKRLGAQSPSPVERRYLDRIDERIKSAYTSDPVLGDKVRGPATESVLSALILVRHDAPSGMVSDETKQALKIMWSLQLRTGDRAGAWAWFGDGGGGEEPWEAFDSQYWGATLAAMAVGMLPPAYRSAPEIQENVRLLKQYLEHGRAKQSLLNRLAVMWAAAKLPDLMAASEKAAVVREVLALQRADGGWSASDLVAQGWKRLDGTAQVEDSDGYATGLAALAIAESGVAQTDSAMNRARSWLISHQDAATGAWRGFSLNRQRDPNTDVGKFMTDAATAYAVLALTEDH